MGYKPKSAGVVPSATILKEIASALGVSADYLLGSDLDFTIRDTVLLKYFKEVDSMPEDLKTALLKVIEAYVQNYKAKQAYS